eukprot:CAMPEP_0113321286 /NCGR_PEP_ID=MMETSP0010_2-20120614/14815_1 /TAXON_ID=216773 ORGANISM="Corethron hystrix, Strain 308" /NCGR_SAMPLE_ID=MMETSP0010_2 /ASSEMBLY_ACC=CAM_ASM_000155 /LENGTH=36 /DNA_ID=CAMNT_0000179357 /DNA_START=158 /DNA_END=268 /DNA_ORIENTATION=+ /assembly_acc=CAM_ASM_000155
MATERHGVMVGDCVEAAVEDRRRRRHGNDGVEAMTG